MRLIEYCDNADPDKLMAASVSGYSFRKRSGLPDDTELILYCREPEKASENPYVKAIYNRVEKPVLDVWNTNSIALNDTWEKSTWEKFACWCCTPCDGSQVIHADYDTLCLGDITQAIPPDARHFSGRMNKEHGESCNGGFYIKNPIYDYDGIWETMLAPLDHPDVYNEIRKSWWYTDEMGVAYYFKRHGYDRFYLLDWRFNQPVFRQKKSKESVWKNDIRVLHYMGRVKPWHEKSQHRYKAQRAHWLNTKKEMEDEFGI